MGRPRWLFTVANAITEQHAIRGKEKAKSQGSAANLLPIPSPLFPLSFSFHPRNNKSNFAGYGETEIEQH